LSRGIVANVGTLWAAFEVRLGRNAILVAMTVSWEIMLKCGNAKFSPQYLIQWYKLLHWPTKVMRRILPPSQSATNRSAGRLG